MDREKLTQLIVEHKERFLKKADLVKREAQKAINPLIKHKEMIVIMGVRRSGKSSLMRLICNDIIEEFGVSPDNILYLNFEDERFVEFKNEDFERLYEVFLELSGSKGKKYFFLDEVQNLDGWERWANRLYEFEDVKLFLTGSNQTLLGKKISTALTGRNRQITIYPFSFSEFLLMKNVNLKKNDLYLREKKLLFRKLFKEYLALGGFPEVLKIKDTSLLEQYFKDIIYRDVVSAYGIRNIKEIKELALFLATNTGTIQSYKNLQKLIGVKSISTVKNYLEILENVFLFFALDVFDYSIKTQMYNQSKLYSIDVALANSTAFKFSQDSGHAFENIVFLELKRRDKEIYYWKSKKNKEVDFVVKEGVKVTEAIQVSFKLSDEKTKSRELEALLSAKDELKVNKLTIITDDEEYEEKSGKTTIRIIPLWKWLLG